MSFSSSRSSIINTYVPPFCIDNPQGGEVLLFDSINKMWSNGPITVASLGGIAPEDLTWKADIYNPGDVVTISTDLLTFVSTARSEFGGPGGGATELNDLSDVGIISPTDKQTLQYDNANSRWTNIFLDYNDLINTPVTFPPDVHNHTALSITYNNSTSNLTAINVQDAIDEVNSRVDAGGDPLSLDDLTDVTIGSLVTGNILSFTGAGWVNSDTVFGDLTTTGKITVEPHPGSPTLSELEVAAGTGNTASFTLSADTAQTIFSQNAGASTVISNRDITIATTGVNTLTLGATAEILVLNGTTVTIKNLQWPQNDGASGQVLTTNGTGGLTFQNITNEVEEAPEDGNVYGRKDAAWAVSTEEAPEDGQTYVRKDGAWIVTDPISSNYESVRVNYNGLGTISNISESSIGITNTAIDSSQWINFEFSHNRPPSSIVYYGYKDLGANGWGYKMTMPSSGNQDNTVLIGGVAGTPAELLTNMSIGKIRIQARVQETFASANEHAYIFFLF